MNKVLEVIKKIIEAYSVIRKNKYKNKTLKLERDALKINRKLKDNNWEVAISNSDSFQVLRYKTEDVLTMFYGQNKIIIRKVKKPGKMKTDNIYMSDVYLMLLDQLTKKNGELESDKYVNEVAQKMWNRIFKKIKETNKFKIVSSKIPYQIKKV